MKGLYYFIERTDTNEWYYCKNEPYEDRGGLSTWIMPSWTRDPLLADRFPSEADAKAFMRHDSTFKSVTEKCVITEHEFVVTHKAWE